MKVKVSEADGRVLDWLVAKAEGKGVYMRHDFMRQRAEYTGCKGTLDWHLSVQMNDPIIGNVTMGSTQSVPAYSTDPSWGWPIIDREGIDLRQLKQSTHETMEMRHFDDSKGDEVYRPPGWKRDMVRRPLPPHPMHTKWLSRRSSGTDSIVNWSKTDFLSDTSLVAAMRCFVSSKFGDEIEVPDELV